MDAINPVNGFIAVAILFAIVLLVRCGFFSDGDRRPNRSPDHAQRSVADSRVEPPPAFSSELDNHVQAGTP